jgi:hypothetical protein
MKSITFISMILIVIQMKSYAQVNFEQFTVLKKALHSAFEELKPNIDHRLTINMPVGDFENYWWELNEVHASYGGDTNSDGITNHRIFLFGGFARLEGMTLDGLAVTACHEIAHGIGGAPFKLSGKSSEGQSDYFATRYCLPIVFKYLKQENVLSFDNYIVDLCDRYSNDQDYCIRAMNSLESDIFFFATLGDVVDFNLSSDNISTEINHSDTFYPDSQCRLDTMIHGVLLLEKPKCWYPQGIERKL